MNDFDHYHRSMNMSFWFADVSQCSFKYRNPILDINAEVDGEL